MNQERQKNVFIVGLDPFNKRQLRSIRNVSRYRFKEALPFETLKNYGKVSYHEMLAEAESVLEESKSPVDGVASFWDFPGSLLVADLTDIYGLPGPSLESALRCEHKYWSRIAQSKATDAVCPFQAINPFDEDVLAKRELSFPFWIKPVKSTDSVLGFRIEDEAGFKDALEHIREGILPVAKAFNELLERVTIPEEIQGVDGSWCIAEEIINGTQHTATGYVTNGHAHVYGIMDCINYPESSSFLCYEYPSNLNEDVKRRIADTSAQVIESVDLDQSAFNIEYFYDQATNRIRILEMNPRVSQSHSNIFKKVDGETDEALAVQIALGEEPDFPSKQGSYLHAAKFYYRVFQDGYVRKIPSPAKVEALETEYDALINVEAEPEKMLSEMREQDSYSFVLAEIFVGANSRDGLKAKYDTIKEQLIFDLEHSKASA